MTIRVSSDAIAAARAAAIVNELDRRGIKLRRVGRELVGPCPRCGGRDRFAVHLVKQVWQCRRCGKGGNVIALVQHLDGVDFPEAIARLAIGKCCATQDDLSTPSATPPDGHQAAMVMWHAAVPIAGTIAEHYLTSTRRLELPDDISPRVLRFHPQCPFGRGVRHPCLLALYRDICTDAPRAVERTALNPDGTAIRIDGKTARQMRGSHKDAAIKITDNADVTMGLTIGEGLESTLAGMMFDHVPAWALGPAAAIAAFPVLSGIETLTILGETDADGTNERASAECSARWIAAGQEAERVMPPAGCSDFNDATMMD
jgi:uncharacterized protein (DUF983 family)